MREVQLQILYAEDKMTQSMTDSWLITVSKKRKQVLNNIPTEWILDSKTIARLKSDKTGLSHNIDQLCSLKENAITHSTLLELQEGIRNNSLSCFEVTSAFCHRAALIHQVVNCLSEIMFTEALEHSKILDQNKYEYSTLPPLYGIPISLKDQCNVEGVDTTLGYLSRAFKPKKKEDESLIVSFLRDLGAIIYVKTTVPPSMMATETTSNTFGYTYNSFNQHFSAGGSSGGEGSLIGCYGSVLGLGTDIGGSIRIPASYHGIFGFKPSTGKVPYLKVDNSWEGREIITSVIGPLARNIDDLRYFMSLIVNNCKPWIHDVKCMPYQFSSFEDSKLPDGLKVGIWYGDGVVNLPSGDMRALSKCKEIIQNNQKFNASIVRWEPPTDLCEEIFNLAMEADLADGGTEINNEFKMTGEPLLDILRPVVPNDSPKPYTVNEWWNLCKRVSDAKQKFRDFHNNLPVEVRPDVVICPSTLMPYRPGDMLETTLRYILFANLLNLPSLSFPADAMIVDDNHSMPDIINGPEDAMVQKMWNDLVLSGDIEGFPSGLQIISPLSDNDDLVLRFGSWLTKLLQES